MRSDILKTLDMQAPELLKISEDFRAHAEDLRVISFVEGKKLRGLNERVRNNMMVI